MGNYFDFVGAGAVADLEDEGGGAWAHASPLGNGQGISPGASTGDHFWPRKGHFKRAHFGLKWALFGAKRLFWL